MGKKAKDLDVDDLKKIIDFDKRDDPVLLDTIAEYGGVEGIAKSLGVSLTSGLKDDSETAIAERQKKYGENRIPQAAATPLWALILMQLSDLMLRILIACALVNIILAVALAEESWIEGVAILITVTIVVCVQSVSDYLAEQKFRKVLLKEKNRIVKVIRDGTPKEVSSYNVVVGDIVVLNSGDEIPADGLFIEGEGCIVTEASLTGEADNIKKHAGAPVMLSGTQVVNGSAHCLVCLVGPATSGGTIQMIVMNRGKDVTKKKGEEEEEEEEEEKKKGWCPCSCELPGGEREKTPLQEKLEVVAEDIGKLGMAAGILTFIILGIKWGVAQGDEGYFRVGSLSDFLHFLTIAVTVVVVAVPEGLPLAVTIALAYGQRKMMDEQNFVRILRASETMGSATTICSDKTGTLTKNEMTVVAASFCSGEVVYDPDATGETREDAIEQLMESLPEDVMEKLVNNLCLNTTCSLGQDEDGKTKAIGNKTEIPLIVFAELLGKDYNEMRNDNTLLTRYNFSSSRKRSSALYEEEDDTVLYVKGASEIILDLCTSRMTMDGVEDVDDDFMEVTTQKIEELASRGLRTLAFAYKTGVEAPSSDEYSAADDDFDAPAVAKEYDLTFIGLVGIKDPLRDNVKDAVAKCQNAGIIVRMVTGDNKITAENIAKQCGILDDAEDAIVLLGEEFRVMSREEQFAILPRLRVLARSSPEDKFVLVNRLKDMNQIVAVTGDGTNDAPALQAAHVGFAMGLTGTDIAKDASHIILRDDNFLSIISAIKWGRNIFDSIRKFLQFQLSINIIALLFTLVGATITGDSPMSAVQLLWVNMIMDTLGALALATEPPYEELLDRPPNHPNEPVMTRGMKIYISYQVIVQMVVLLVVIYEAETFFPIAEGYKFDAAVDIDINKRILTYVFTVFILLQIFNEFLARHLDFNFNLLNRMHKAPQFVVILIAIVVIQILVVQFAGTLANTVALDAEEWGICLAFAAVLFPIDYFIRAVAHIPAVHAWIFEPWTDNSELKEVAVHSSEELSSEETETESVEETSYA